MSIPFIRDDQTTGPGIYKPHPNIIRIVAPNAGPFTYTGTGTYLLHSKGHCVVLDPGPEDQNHIDAIVAAAGNTQVDAILVTHTHRDHSPGSRPLQRHTKASILGCRAAKRDESSKQAVTLDESQDFDYVPQRVLDDGEIVTVGDITLRVFATPGHIANHLCFFWEEERALFSGDHIMGWATSVVIPPDGHMASYMDSLERTLELAPKSIWPTHGQPVLNTAEFIQALISHRQARESAIFEQVSGGNGQISDIVETLYQDVPKALHPAAAQSVFAHMIHLAEQNRVKPSTDLTINDFFETCAPQ